MVKTSLIYLFVSFYLLKIASSIDISKVRKEMYLPNKIEGDIKPSLISRNKINAKGGVSKLSTRWPNSTVPYLITDFYNADEAKKIEAALKNIEDDTRVNGKDCVRFIPRTNQTSYIKIVSDDGCNSFVGKQSDTTFQELSLLPVCVHNGAIIHEFLHALGMWHEQSRPDRDDYIKVKYENIQEQFKFAFDKYSPNEIDTSEPYDYNSVMHYDTKAFTKNGLDTIEPLKEGALIGQFDRMSKIDINELRKMYNCGTDKLVWAYDSLTNFEKADGCSFKGNDLKIVLTKPDSCAQTCASTFNCTHFNYEKKTGKCILKTNKTVKNNAYLADSNLYFCGVQKECIDEDLKCLKMAFNGQCETNSTYMKENCCKSCTNCKDLVDDCSDRARNGECDNNSIYMQENCCNSCKNRNVCVDKDSMCSHWTSTGQCDFNPSFMNETCCNSCKNACLDKNQYCQYWSSIGECKTDPGYMLKNCCSSCTYGCENRFAECDNWASYGFCNDNSIYMLTNCCKSCSVVQL